MNATDQWIVLKTDDYQHHGLRRGFLLEVLEDRGDTWLATDGTATGQYVLPKMVFTEPQGFNAAYQRAQRMDGWPPLKLYDFGDDGAEG